MREAYISVISLVEKYLRIVSRFEVVFEYPHAVFRIKNITLITHYIISNLAIWEYLSKFLLCPIGIFT